jgi:hypothetical protein
VPLPATIVPVTLVVLHPGPVQTEIGSALAVPWAKETIPKIASASSEFFKVENLGISVSLGGDKFQRFSRTPGPEKQN